MSDEQQQRRAGLEEVAAAKEGRVKHALAELGKTTSGWLSPGERAGWFRRRNKETK